jgi:hypothetical protein
MKNKTEVDLFPHFGFPIRLEYQDGKEHRVCWFQSKNHLDKHLTRYNLNPKDLKIDYQDPSMEEPEQPEKPKRGRKPKAQLFSPLEQFFESNEKTVAPVGTRTGREGTQKRRRGRPSSNS